MINMNVIRNIDRVRKCARGTVITGGGSSGGDAVILFLLLKGKAGVYANDPAAGNSAAAGNTAPADLIRTLGAGDFFADPGLLLGKTAAYTTVSLSDAIILPIGRNSALDFMREEPAIALELIRELSLLLEQMSTAYKALIVQHDAERRLRAKPVRRDGDSALGLAITRQGQSPCPTTDVIRIP